jgi:hypothetical protein
MAKVSELIEGAFRLSNITPAGETLEEFQTAEGLRVLNQMLADWSLDRQGVYTITKEALSVVSGTAEYSIGTGATFDTTRPNRVTFAYVRQNGQDYNLTLVDREWQASRQNKSALTGRPWEMLYEPTYPNGTITLYPKPDANYTLYLQSVKPLAVYSSANDSLTLPPEYERAIEYNLAIAIANRYGQSVGQETAMVADDSLKKLKKLHSSPTRRTKTRVSGAGVQRDYDITGDYFYR